MSELPESLFLKTYREVEMEILDSHGLRPQDDAEIANLIQGIAVDRVIEIKVREYLERRP